VVPVLPVVPPVRVECETEEELVPEETLLLNEEELLLTPEELLCLVAVELPVAVELRLT